MSDPTRGEAAGLAAFACVATAWQAHEAELRAYLRRRVADADSADDLVQDVFVKAMRQGRGFCALDNPRAWLFRVARNALIDRARTAHPQEPIDAHAESLAAPARVAPAPVDELGDCLLRVLDELPPDDAGILRRCDIEGQTQRAYADAHGLSLAAAKSRLLRARQRLRERMTSVCRVSFDADGSVSGHLGRAARPAP